MFNADYTCERREGFAPGIKYLVNTKFLNGCICGDGTVIPIEESVFPELFYYEANNTFWIPTGNKTHPDKVIVKW